MDDFDDKPGKTDAACWLDKLANAERTFKYYQERADKVDKEYANLERMANTNRDKELNLFWANVQVLAPSIYSRPPVPVVVPRFQDRRPIRRTASELLERVACTTFDLTDIDQVMLSVRDDMAIVGRGAAWIRYETKEDSDTPTERVVIEHLDRRDFGHDPARQWCDVDFVYRKAYLTRKEMKKRFGEEKAQDVTYSNWVERSERNLNGHPTDYEQKACIYEVWCRSEDRVMWLSEGYEDFLDEDKPHLKLDGFFPTPRPAYATLSRGTLVPVPDFYLYVDQLSEVNELTDRIHKLSDAVVVRGFYPSGAGELGDAMEAAFNETTNARVLIPVSGFAAFGGTAPKDNIVWLPIDMIVTTIAQCVEMRKQLIDDVYQITGLSDIMRGSTAATETATAQQLKSQYGSIRVRDRQNELVRYARDLVRISAEIVAEEFSQKTLLDMSQMEIPTDADIEKAIEGIQEQSNQLQAQAAQAMQMMQTNPEIMQQARQNPEQAQQMLQQAQSQLQEQLQGLQSQAAELAETVTIEQVTKLLRDERLRPFVLDIETDSTIQPDEDAAKQRAVEFVGAVGSFMQQAIMAVQTVPQSAPLMAETLKYVAGQFRTGREMQAAIDGFADQVAQMGQQPNPQEQAAQQQAQAEQARVQAENERTQAEMQIKQQEMQAKLMEAQQKAQLEQAKAQTELEARAIEAQSKQAESNAKIVELQMKGEQEREKHVQAMQKGALEMAKMQAEMERMQLDSALKIEQASQSASLAERAQATKEQSARGKGQTK